VGTNLVRAHVDGPLLKLTKPLIRDHAQGMLKSSTRLLRIARVLNKTPILLVVFATLVNSAFVVSDFSGSSEAAFWPSAFSHINDFSTLFIVVFNGLLVLVTYSLVVSTNKLWESASEQSRDLKRSIAESTRAADAMESVSASLKENTATTKAIIANQRTYAALQMRAYLSVVTGACVPQDATTNWRYEVRMIVKNTGHTTANAVNVISRLKIFESPLPDNIDLSLPIDLRDDAAHIASGNTFFFPSVLDNMISESEIEEVVKGSKRRMYVYGTVHYKDIFGELTTPISAKFVLGTSKAISLQRALVGITTPVSING